MRAGWWRRLRWRVRPLTVAQTALLCALAEGRSLKGHRFLDGEKEFRLYDGSTLIRPVPEADVNALQERGLLDSNLKFPAATFILSARGAAAARRLCAPHQGETGRGMP